MGSRARALTAAQVPAVPLLFVHSLGVGLEPPTEAQKEEAVRRRVSRPERRPHRKPLQAPRGAVPAHEADALALEPGAALRVSTTVRFKRNVAKGPNPLAAKKKRKVAPPARPASAPETEVCGRPAALSRRLTLAGAGRGEAAQAAAKGGGWRRGRGASAGVSIVAVPGIVRRR